MGWLAIFGLLHYYLVWFGDILFLYSVIGMIAWLFRDRDSESLIKWAFWLILARSALMALCACSSDTLSAAAAPPVAAPEVVGQRPAMKAGFGFPGPATLPPNLTPGATRVGKGRDRPVGTG